VPASQSLRLQIFRPDGSLVRTLLDGAVPAPTGVVTWDGRDARGLDVPDGVYMYRLTGEGFERSGKVVRVR
jgi:flagellar hook assembly protein FlgD